MTTAITFCLVNNNLCSRGCNLCFYHSELPKTVDDSTVKLDKDRLSVESSLESVAEAMLDPG